MATQKVKLVVWNGKPEPELPLAVMRRHPILFKRQIAMMEEAELEMALVIHRNSKMEVRHG